MGDSGQPDVRAIIETLFDTYDTDDSKFLEESEVRNLLKDLYSDMGQGEPDEETIQGFMAASGDSGKFTKDQLVDLLSPIFEEGLNEEG
jgi:Ca2+-binding EF-hand superfamily protein